MEPSQMSAFTYLESGDIYLEDKSRWTEGATLYFFNAANIAIKPHAGLHPCRFRCILGPHCDLKTE